MAEKLEGEIVILNDPEGAFEQALEQHPNTPGLNPRKPSTCLARGTLKLIRRFDHRGRAWLVLFNDQEYGWLEDVWLRETTGQPGALTFTGQIEALEGWSEEWRTEKAKEETAMAGEQKPQEMLVCACGSRDLIELRRLPKDYGKCFSAEQEHGLTRRLGNPRFKCAACPRIYEWTGRLWQWMENAVVGV